MANELKNHKYRHRKEEDFIHSGFLEKDILFSHIFSEEYFCRFPLQYSGEEGGGKGTKKYFAVVYVSCNNPQKLSTRFYCLEIMKAIYGLYQGRGASVPNFDTFWSLQKRKKGVGGAF